MARKLSSDPANVRRRAKRAEAKHAAAAEPVGIIGRIVEAFANTGRKAWAALSPAYRRRLERAAAQGKTSRKAARGKSEDEYAVRKKREQEAKETLGKLTTAERSYVRKQAARLARRIGEPQTEAALEYATAYGMPRFRALIKQIDGMRAQYKKERAAGTYASRGWQMMEQMAAAWEAPDARWFYYK
jgi:hypothetical protein